MFFVLVLSPKDGARARNRSICRFDYEHEHHFIEHEHEFKLKDVGKNERVSDGQSHAYASGYELSKLSVSKAVSPKHFQSPPSFLVSGPTGFIRNRGRKKNS